LGEEADRPARGWDARQAGAGGPRRRRVYALARRPSSAGPHEFRLRV